MNWLDKHQMKIFYGMLGVLLVFTVFIGFSVRGKCASQTNTEIPYNVAEWANYNQIMLDRIDIAKTYFYSYFPQYSNYSILIWTDDGYYDNNIYRYVFMFEPQFNNTISNDFNFSSNTIELYSDYEIFIVLIESNGNGYGVLEPHSHYASLLGNAGSINTPVGSYLPRYPFYYDGEPVLSSNNLEVLISRVSGQSPSGSATEPDLTGDNIGNDKPDIDDYLPQLPSQPSFDNSSLESMVESIYNWLKWEYNAIKGTLEGLISFLADTFTYSIQKVIDNIKNSMKNFYDNMKSLFEPLLNGISELLNSISENVNYILEPIDSQAINDSIEGTNFYGIYSDYKSFFNTFDSVITGTSEPNSLIIPIHLENISTLAQFGVTCQYLDLTQFAEIRSPLRAFCWVFCSFGAIMLVAHSLPDWLKGSSGGGSSSVSGKEG